MLQKNNPGSDLSFEQHLTAMSKTGKTAISRKIFSAPVKHLIKMGLFDNLNEGFKVLDYGCGKGKDVELLQEKYPHLKVDGYDPNFRRLDLNGPYNIIICNYVLNVISLSKVRDYILGEIHDLLNDSGVAYIAVRNDISNLKGLTSKGTWQGKIELNLDVLHQNNNFKQYRMTKHG